ncbi:unnamed protein product [Paramecium sonneborni]|uniref:Uncharacterized protein n=1 Tax=Paramecium sonneborni TaxID=65129 RepID=A0A8S1RTC9_9CILI|nr:unnamed protein product [Paramecium sonneborni]
MNNENNQKLQKSEKDQIAKRANSNNQEIIYENIQIRNKVKSSFDYQLLLNVVSNSFLFVKLQCGIKINLIERKLYKLEKNLVNSNYFTMLQDLICYNQSIWILCLLGHRQKYIQKSD